MAASDNLSEYQFSSTVKTWKKHPNLIAGVVKAKKGNRIVGHLKWTGTTGSQVRDLNGATVSAVHVEEPHRRKGVATELWKKANEDVNQHGISLNHSMNQSSEGKVWSKSLTSPI
jgi:GNAT superfamily N-acetyltransferase